MNKIDRYIVLVLILAILLAALVTAIPGILPSPTATKGDKSMPTKSAPAVSKPDKYLSPFGGAPFHRPPIDNA